MVVNQITLTKDSSNLRKYLLLTLSRVEETAERRKVDKRAIIQRIHEGFERFKIATIIVAHGANASKGAYFQAGILLGVGVQRRSTPRTFQRIFPEFKGEQLDLKYYKAWASLCKYLLEAIPEDQAPLVWGSQSLLQIKAMALAQTKHKLIPFPGVHCIRPISREVIQKLSEIDQWHQVYKVNEISDALLFYYNNIRAMYEDLQAQKELHRGTLQERLTRYLEERGWPEEYTVEDLLEKYFLLDWIGCNLIFHRPIKTKQLLLYGKPSTQKTLLFDMLDEVLNIYHASAHKNDFSGAHDDYDLWIFDDFNISEDTKETISARQDAMAAENNTLLRILDGQKCRLDSKHGKLFLKKRNVPVVTIMNSPPQSIRVCGSFHERFVRLMFNSNIPNIEKERLIATLHGCILRRLQQMGVTWEEAYKISIQYNEDQAYVEFQVPIDRPVNTRFDHLPGRPYGIERLLEVGDRGVLLPINKKQIVTIALEYKGDFDAIRRKENMSFAGQMSVEQLYNNGSPNIDRSSEEPDSMHIKGNATFSLLDFSFVPLRVQQEVKASNQNIKWKIHSTYKRQWRPFSIGVLQQDKLVPELQWAEWDAVLRLDGSQEGGIAYYAAWPLQMYCQGFRTSNSLRLTYIREEEWQPHQWIGEITLGSGEITPEKGAVSPGMPAKIGQTESVSGHIRKGSHEEEVRSTNSLRTNSQGCRSNSKTPVDNQIFLRETVEVTLKIAGGTVRERAKEGAKSSISEIWEPEDT